ncbi:hypothetical protein MRX96_053283 [Rhipicephalus microplus]
MHGTSSKEAGVKKPPRQTGPSPALTRARKLQAAKGSHTTGKTGIPTPTSRPLNRAAPVSSGRTAKSAPTPSALKPVVLTTTCSKAAMLSSPQQGPRNPTLLPPPQEQRARQWKLGRLSRNSWQRQELAVSVRPQYRGITALLLPPPDALSLPNADIEGDVTQDIEIDWEFFASLRRGRKPPQPSADSAYRENKETPTALLPAQQDDVRGESQAASSQTTEASRAPDAPSVSLAHEQAPSLSGTSFPAVLPVCRPRVK